MPYRSRVQVFFLLPFLLWIYHLKKQRQILSCNTSVSFLFIHLSIQQFNLSFHFVKITKKSLLFTSGSHGYTSLKTDRRIQEAELGFDIN